MSFSITITYNDKEYVIHNGECCECAFWCDGCKADQELRDKCGETDIFTEL